MSSVPLADTAPDLDLRQALVQAGQALDAHGANHGSTGNLSVRGVERGGGFWITPSGMAATALTPQALAWVGDDGSASGPWQPSSEWPFHRAIYRQRADLHAVVHTHAPHAAALACLERGVPPLHYMVAVAGGADIPCVPYQVFGSEALSAAVGAAFAERNACLMAHHGLVAAGRDIAHAVRVAQEVEWLCDVTLKVLAVTPEPALLTPEQMAEVIERFKGYGQSRRRA